MATKTDSDILRKGDVVIAREDLRRVPAGTRGKIILSVGLDWIRYWVRFENGVETGSVNRSKLATPDEWERRHDEPVAAAAGDAASDGGGAGETAAVGAEVNGVMVPQKLLDRSKAAHERLGR